MPDVRANEIQIEYETLGDPSSSPLLLIMGLGAQMIFWPGGFCEQLAMRGHYVIRYDNRDVGLSYKIEEAGVPNVSEAIAAFQRGEEVKAPYSLDDMAQDAIGLLDALGIEKAHICGMSMGGMIAQIMVIRYPARVRNLVSLESSTSDPDLPEAKPEARAALLTRPPAEREAYIAHMVDSFQTIAGSTSLFDRQLAREQAALYFDRCYYPQGVARQLVAVLAAKNRKQALKSVEAPTLVIHGSEDPLVPVEHGIATAEAIPGAKLVIIEGMGHGLAFPAIWPRLVDAITEHTRNAGG